uniref:BED-type domain-containing protein n=1 Tax=Solanum lycopersicum TaxID=4081 RepID=A0A3Q7FG57_SOLLC
VREKDVCWEYAEKLEGNKVRCKFCLRILNGGISRLKHHLSRLPSKGVNPCTKVRDDVTDRVRDIIGSKEPPSTKKHKLIETKALANISPEKPLLSVEPITPIARIFPPIGQAISSSGNNQENAERSIALFFFENKIDFGVARSSSYHQMIEAVGKCGSGFIGPSPETLKATWLERIKSEVSLQSKDVEKEWAMTGCTLIAETWTDNKMKALINFLVSSPSRTFFYKSVDASSYFKNLKCLSELFDSIIQDFGPENVVQVIVDNTLHCILQAQSLSKFIYNNSPLLDLMKKFTGGQEIIKTGITKSVSNFLSLQCLLKHRSRLKVIFNSPELAANSAYTNKSQSVNCITILDDNDFWRTAEECVAVSEPFLKVMREVSGGKPAVGTIYELLTRKVQDIFRYSG